MEEASALANKVGILATRMLAAGTPGELESRYANYEVHISERNSEEANAARAAMARVPGARQAEDVAMRFEVPIRSSQHEQEGGLGVSLPELFALLDNSNIEWTVERPSLESVFLKVIRAHEVEEEDAASAASGWWTWRRLASLL
jgi:ATP-binding cassette, subfamily A (ABC1), member 3